jgi:hypothetical protein
MIAYTPKRTGLLMKIRRARTLYYMDHRLYRHMSDAKILEKVTNEMREIAHFPMRKVRQIARSV